MYRMAGLLSTLPVGKDMEQLLNYYWNNMLMSISVGGYETQLSLRSTFNFGICSRNIRVRVVPSSSLETR